MNLKETAIAQAAYNNANWIDAAIRAITADPERLPIEFTADDIRPLCCHLPDPSEPRAMGALMRRLHRLGFARPTNAYRPSRREANHYRPQRVWILLDPAANAE